MIALLAALFAAALGLRVLPHRLAPLGSGVDHWFWLAYIEEFRRTRKFPPHLPQYVLDQHQWYPPVFPLALAHLPSSVFERFNRQIAVFIDLLRMLMAMGATAFMCKGDTVAIVIAGVIYATVPIQISYNTQLNPRGLGALMLDAMLLLLLWKVEYAAPGWLWVAIFGLSGLILLTHKMTTQLFWFIAIGSALLYRDWRFALLVPGSMLVATVISGGFYVKVLRAHWDIVRFWAKHWPWIGSDMIRESPVYREEGYERARKLHRAGLRGLLWQCFILAGFSPAAWVACVLVYERLFVVSPLLIYPTYLLVWLLLAAILALMSTFIPTFKAIGAGYLYLYNTSLLAALLMAVTYRYTVAPAFSTAIIGAAIVLNSLGLIWYYRTVPRNRRWSIDHDFSAILQELASRPRGVVMCIPPNWYDVVAYKTRQPVLWGAHGYGFRRVEPTFPRLLIPLPEIFERYGVRYLLSLDGALSERFSSDMPPASTTRIGSYTLYDFGAPRAVATR